MTKGKVYANVWDAIEPDPAKAENLELCSSLMLAFTRHIEREGLTQMQAAKAFDVTRHKWRQSLRKTKLIDDYENHAASGAIHAR